MLFPGPTGAPASGIDLRKEMSDLLRDHGYPVLIRRVDRSKRCSCWIDDKHNTGDPDCPNCLGDGWCYTDEQVQSYEFKRGSYLNAEFTDEVGMLSAHDAVFYFEHTVAPQEKDFIVEVVTDLEGVLRQPLQVKRIWAVATTIPRICANKTQFWEAYCNERHLGK